MGTTADGRPASALLLGAAQTDDAVLQLAARLLDEPRDRARAEEVPDLIPAPTTTVEELL